MGSKLLRSIVIVSAGMMAVVLTVVLLSNSTLKKQQLQTGTDLETESETVTAMAGTEGTDTLQTGTNLRAFLSDDSFFDEDSATSDMTVQYGQSASLVVTSVDHDIRIHIVNVAGSLIAGEDFTVSIEGNGTYRDSDQDGTIYISPVKPGNYQVHLDLMEGYRVPEKPTAITVKQNIEYQAIKDIQVMILSEKDVNAAKEDIQLAAADVDEDSTQRTDLRTDNTGAKLGIDVSKWNHDIDWEKVKEAGVDFAIIRCGYRGSETGNLIEDPEFQTNMEGAVNAGISVGVYFFSQAVNEAEAVEEASTVLSLCQNYPVTYPMYIDSESANGVGRADELDIKARTDICRAFCETIQNAGYDSGVYASRTWLKKNLDTDSLSGYQIWLAEYRDVPQYDGYYEMWQYTSKGTIDGITGNVDLNLYYVKNTN